MRGGVQNQDLDCSSQSSPSQGGVNNLSLLDPEGLRFNCFSMSSTMSSLRSTNIPTGFRVINTVYLAIGDISTTRLDPGESAPDGTTYLEIVKTVNVETQKSVALSIKKLMALGYSLKSTLVAWPSLAICMRLFGAVFRNLQTPTSSISSSGPRSIPSTTKSRMFP